MFILDSFYLSALRFLILRPESTSPKLTNWWLHTWNSPCSGWKCLARLTETSSLVCVSTSAVPPRSISVTFAYIVTSCACCYCRPSFEYPIAELNSLPQICPTTTTTKRKKERVENVSSSINDGYAWSQRSLHFISNLKALLVSLEFRSHTNTCLFRAPQSHKVHAINTDT